MASRVTQETKVVVANIQAATNGGNARVTQVAKIVIATIQLSGGGLLTKGVGS